MAHSSTDKDQQQRFIDAARELGCEEGLDQLDEALRRVGTAPPKPQKSTVRPALKPAPGRKASAPK